MAQTTTYDRVYVWQAPVRMYHWVNVCCIFLLVSTGLIIGRPPAFLSASEASASYWFGWVRFVHFVSAFIMTFAFMIRVYWMFVGNKYARWDAFIPNSLAAFKRQLVEAKNVLWVDILQIQKRPVDYVGHNGLAAFSYFAIFLSTIFQICTGFALYSPMSTAWLPQMFSWVSPLMGGDNIVRLWHHTWTWVFVMFTIIHVYLSIFHDMTEGKGEISSIITGARFVERK
jgi:Ni/Fe-hydrogenase 1 B-type cytochrome subunit